MTHPSLDLPRSGAAPDAQRVAALRRTVDHAAHLLPAQGPITVFVHHNTLHALEDLPFHDAVTRGARLFGCQPYLSEERYHHEQAKGRIRCADLEFVLREELGSSAEQPVLGTTTRLQLRLAMLQHPLRGAAAAELRWYVAETEALRRFLGSTPAETQQRLREETRHWIMRDVAPPSKPDRGHAVNAPHKHDRHVRESLAGVLRHYGSAGMERWSAETWEAVCLEAMWRACRDGVHGIKAVAPHFPTLLRHRDVLLEVTGQDADLYVNDVLIRFCAAFLDQGFSHWSLPQRQQGFLQSFAALYSRPGGPPDAWLHGLRQQMRHVLQTQPSAESLILESLDALGVQEKDWESFLTATLLALRGWAGMIRQMELRADRAVQPAPPGSLLQLLAVRLLLERLALSYIARTAVGYHGPLSRMRHSLSRSQPKSEAATVDQRAFPLFQLAQILGWLPQDLFRLAKADWRRLVEEVESFSSLERRRLLHRAFERKYHIQVLDAIHVSAARTQQPALAPRYQVICCIDEREESFRRHLEEVSPHVQTFGVAGFFNAAIYYRGAADAHYVPLCPVVIRPQHWVTEEVVFTFDESHRRRARTRRALGTASHQFHIGSRSFAGGALLAAGLGALASVPLVMRVLFPRFTASIRRTASRLVQPPQMTKLQLERSTPRCGPQPGQIGFSVEEMTDIGERTLRDCGLTRDFAALVLLLGHGSNSVNNPHKSAYDCGACGGGGGGPNARAVAQMLNDPRVRQLLSARGLEIPAGTLFVGGFHNTCIDSVSYYDLDRLPTTHQSGFQSLVEAIEQACDRNAHERCRRFQSAPLTLSFPAARRHVEGRAEDLAQTRPECGHATNAICFVGRRERTRGLFMDRRAFLTSYDPTQDDPQATILTRILQAVFPVCAGINLEYYFSYVDPAGWGCGTKLPHNVSALLGIMDGAASDLRPGLPWQMVEIHEPVRLLFVVETTPHRMQQIIQQQPAIGLLCRNEWVSLATLDPSSDQLHVFRRGEFIRHVPEDVQLPIADSSFAWYRGWREHLGFALLTGDRSGAQQPSASSTVEDHRNSLPAVRESPGWR